VHPIFKPLHDFLAGKDRPMLPTFAFDAEVRCEFTRAGEPKFAIVHCEVAVEAEDEEAACLLAAREILRDVSARIGATPRAVSVLHSHINREEA
jgi:hypothetical protein